MIKSEAPLHISGVKSLTSMIRSDSKGISFPEKSFVTPFIISPTRPELLLFVWSELFSILLNPGGSFSLSELADKI